MNINLQLHVDLKLDTGDKPNEIEAKLAKLGALIEQASTVLATLGAGDRRPEPTPPAPAPPAPRKYQRKAPAPAVTTPIIDTADLAESLPAAATTNGNSHTPAPAPAIAAAPAPAPAIAAAPAPAPEPEPASSHTMSMAQFDSLVRAEMKRLSLDGRMPGYALWNDGRSPSLPTLGAVLARYQVKTLADLAEIIGMRPPLSATRDSQLNIADLAHKPNP